MSLRWMEKLSMLGLDCVIGDWKRGLFQRGCEYSPLFEAGDLPGERITKCSIRHGDEGSKGPAFFFFPLRGFEIGCLK